MDRTTIMLKTFSVFLLLVLISVMLPMTHADTTTDEHTITIIVYGDAQVFLCFPINGSAVPIGNGTYYFSHIIGILAYAPQGYDLYVNGTEFHQYYGKLFNVSTVLVIDAFPVYDKLNINLNQNGSIILHFLNGTEEELTSSASFTVLNTTYIWLTSSIPFMVDKGTMITNYFGEYITGNTTWNITFNPPIPQNYLNVSVKIINQGAVNMTVYNGTTYLSKITLTHTESFLIPKGYSIGFYSYKDNFTVNDKEAFFMKNKGYSVYYYGIVKYNTTIIIIFTTGSSNITSAITNASITVNNVHVTNETNTTLVSTQYKGNNGVSPLLIYVIISLIIIIIFYVIIRIRKQT